MTKFQILSLLPAVVLYGVWTYIAWKHRTEKFKYMGGFSNNWTSSWVGFNIICFTALAILLPLIAFNQ